MSKAIELVEHTNYWTIPTSDLVVYRCMIDHAFSIVAMTKSIQITIEIESDFELEANGKTQMISPNDIKTLGEALVVLNKPLTSLKMYKAGRLEVQIANFRVKVEPDEYEAWQMSSDTGLRIICMPGGDLAIWLPE